MYAHSDSSNPNDCTGWEPLFSDGSGGAGHLNQVAERCAGFAASAFEGAESGKKGWGHLARLLGNWHDLGKFSAEFQVYLRQSATAGDDAHTVEVRGKVDHTTAGAQYAVEVLPPGYGALLAYAIAGHHAGLLDGHGSGACMTARLGKKIPEWCTRAPNALLDPGEPPRFPLGRDTFTIGFLTRVLFSCLVDADFLSTESFMDPDRASARPRPVYDFERLDGHLTSWIDSRFGPPVNGVNQARAEVLNACRSAAEGKPGLYSLTVPTGGARPSHPLPSPCAMLPAGGCGG